VTANLPEPVLALVRELKKLPGVGDKTATRYVLNLLERSPEGMQTLISNLGDVAEGVGECAQCGFISVEDLCEYCSDPGRDRATLCVVEGIADVIAFEKVGEYRGMYHVLGGAISALRGVTPDKLRIKDFARRVRVGGIEEVILATGADAEGETTALYLKRLLDDDDVKVTRPATGIPMGSSIEFLDAVTLMRAMRGRTRLQ